MNEDNKIFLPSSIIFNNALEIWLELRKEINSTNETSEQQQQQQQQIFQNTTENKHIIATDIKFEVYIIYIMNFTICIFISLGKQSF